ncbi:hypothetical protein [Zavarzinia aquatilis]|uniref:Uncharacterized protein n=1 Tax=Zavarzinia aquatilis TaxID=2211142 RepID=A0A317EIC3_9PROT|nr:hypothetical protein [Zavarzinia aquatilis]PWR24985.1 hypothetical protein DKG74_04240 [Zavarzinia aquatilis]
MDPFTASALLAGSAGLQAVSSIQQGNAAASAANWNAGQMDAAATRTLAATNAEEDRLRRQQAQELGRQRAAFAESGLAPSGSVLDVMTESATNAELDALTLRYRGQVEANDLRNQGSITRWQGRQARRAGYIGAGAALLSGASSFAGMPGLGSAGGIAKGAKDFGTVAGAYSSLPKVM